LFRLFVNLGLLRVLLPFSYNLLSIEVRARFFLVPAFPSYFVPPAILFAFFFPDAALFHRGLSWRDLRRVLRKRFLWCNPPPLTSLSECLRGRNFAWIFIPISIFFFFFRQFPRRGFFHPFPFDFRHWCFPFGCA